MTDTTSNQQIHATCVAFGAEGVLLRGESGSGKSDLALRLMDAGALLVADDRVDLARDALGILASAPATIAGMMEVRGIGIVQGLPHVTARVSLVVDLVARDDVPRMPEAETVALLGLAVPLVRLHAFDISTPVKIRLALDGR